MTAPINNPPMEESGGGGGGGNVFTNRLGPFPLWVWMGLGLAGLLVFANFSKNKKAAAGQNNGTLPTTQTASGSTPASLIPQFVNQVYENPSPPVVNLTNNTTVNGGEEEDNDHRPHPLPHPTPGPVPPPAPRPNPPPQGQWVTVGVWNSTNAPWNSTLWGIAQHTYGNGSLYPKIFAANKTGVMRPDGTAGFITNPDLIHPGDRIWVPA